MQNNYLQQISSDIGNINTILADLQIQETSIRDEYNVFITEIDSKLSELKNTIKQNNIIMDRQKANYDKLNIDYISVENKNEDAEKLDKIAKINTNLISNTSDSNSTLVILYPLVIFILFICLIYLIYITYTKFMITIYVDYS